MSRIKIAGSVFILAAMLITGILIFALPEKSFSENENRVLSEKPKLSTSAIMTGDFQKKLDTYLSDQFPGRNALMKLGTAMKILSGRRDIENTYIGKDNYYFEKITDADIDQDNYKKNLERINAIADKYDNIKFAALLVPSSGIVLEEKLPENASLYDAESLYSTAEQAFSKCKLVNPTNDLKAAKEQYIYYSTDHHWTTSGAYIGYKTFLGENAKYSYDDNKKDIVSDAFLGTLYSRTLDYRAVPDIVEIAEVSEEIEVIIDGKIGNIYDLSSLTEKDKYKVFFGGNYGLTEINTGKGSGTLMVLKDSFANCMIPFMTEDYRRIIMIDLRYYSDSVSNLLDNGDIDEVLVLYELKNFTLDTNLAKLML